MTNSSLTFALLAAVAMSCGALPDETESEETLTVAQPAPVTNTALFVASGSLGVAPGTPVTVFLLELVEGSIASEPSEADYCDDGNGGSLCAPACDLMTDPDNCGFFGNVCGSTEACVQGSCL